MHLIDKKLIDSVWNVEDLINIKSSPALISFVNPFSYYWLVENSDVVSKVDYFFADGGLLVRCHNLFYGKYQINRKSFDFSSVAHELLSYCEENNLVVGFVGASQEENEGAIKNIKSRYSKISVGYSRHGYFDSEEDREQCISAIRQSSIDVLLVGMGSPYQENFSISLKNSFGNSRLKLIITCGGFLTQTSIKTDYYHPIIKKTGLRWLQRMVMHKHVRDKVFSKYPSFILKYFVERIFLKHN